MIGWLIGFFFIDALVFAVIGLAILVPHAERQVIEGSPVICRLIFTACGD